MHSQLEDVEYLFRNFSPIAMAGFGFGLFCLSIYWITRWREFLVIGLTAAIYVIPFATMGTRW